MVDRQRVKLRGFERLVTLVDGVSMKIVHSMLVTGSPTPLLRFLPTALLRAFNTHPRMRALQVKDQDFTAEIQDPLSLEDISTNNLLRVQRTTQDAFDNWQQYAEDECNIGFDRYSQLPFFLTVWVDEKEERARLMLFSDHYMSDGFSGMVVLNSILEHVVSLARQETLQTHELSLRPSFYDMWLSKKPFSKGLMKTVISLLGKAIYRSEMKRFYPVLPARSDQHDFVVPPVSNPTSASFTKGDPQAMSQTLARCKDEQVTFGGAVVCATFLAFYHAAKDLPGFDPTKPFKLATDLDYNMRRRVPQPVEEDLVGTYVAFADLGCLAKGVDLETTKFWDLARRAKSEIDLKVHQTMLLAAVPIILDQRINAKIQPSFAKALNIRQSQTSDANLSNIGRYPFAKEHSLGDNGDTDVLKVESLHVYNPIPHLGPSAVLWVASVDSFCYSMGHKCQDEAAKALFTAFVKKGRSSILPQFKDKSEPTATNPDDVDMSELEEKEEERTQAFPRELPMENDYTLPDYYVRKCYSEYYNLILKKLETYDIVTVTGTPGIGKSIFYAYFFQRYKEDKPETTIITASFTKNSGIGQVVVFQDGKQPEQWREGNVNTFINTAHKAAEPNVTYLYDGPPQRPPNSPSKMVCFTSPNERWLRQIAKEGTATMVYMPLWTLDELCDAASKLKLGAGVTQQKLEERFAVFGGVAHCCLSADEGFVAEMTQYLIKDIADMDSLLELKRLMKNGRVLTRHRMYHYQPQANRRFYEDQIASTFASRLVLGKLTARDFEKRAELLQLLQGIPNEVAIRLHLFEMKVHEQLVRGGAIQTQCLSKPEMSMKRFKLNKSKEFCFFDHKQLSSATLVETGPYHIPRAANLESVYSFYCPRSPKFLVKRKLLLFQMTVALRNPVKGMGIVALLRAVGWLDKALEDPTRVALILVCVDDSETDIKHKQRIQWTPAADEESVNLISSFDDTKTTALGCHDTGGFSQ